MLRVEQFASPGVAETIDAADDVGERLLKAAAEVFAERGYDKAGVAEIARRAGVTTGAIYGRYPGKAELLVEAVDPHASDELEALFADHHFQGRMKDILLAAGARLIDRSHNQVSPSLLLEAFVSSRRHPEMGRVLRSRVLERQNRLAEIIAAAKADGGIDDSIDTDALVTFCHALGFGFLLVEALDLDVPHDEPWAVLIARLVESLRPGEPVTSDDGNKPPPPPTRPSKGE